MAARILFIGTACPFGDVSGSGIRTRSLLGLLQRLGPVTAVFATGRPWTDSQVAQTRCAHSVALYTNYEETRVQNVVERWRKTFDPTYLNTNGVIVPRADAERVAELVDSHDVVWIHTFKLANAFRRFHWPHSIIDVDDYPSRFHRSAIRYAPTISAKLVRCQKAFSWRRHERMVLKRFTVVAVCKPSDRKAFGSTDRVHVVPNGFAIPEAAAGGSTRAHPKCRLGMIGDFDYLPNRDGLGWFLRRIWPRVRGRVPGAELRLVGKGSESAAGVGAPGVLGLGYVPVVDEEIASWCGMIVPTRMGGGTHLKVVEGLARRVPIATTSHGARGYALTTGVHALIADSEADFVAACETLLLRPEVGERMAAEGFRYFQSNFSWEAIFPRVEQAVRSCLGHTVA